MQHHLGYKFVFCLKKKVPHNGMRVYREIECRGLLVFNFRKR